MQKFIGFVYLMFFLIVITNSNAAIRKLTVDDAVKTAIENSYDTKASKLSVQKADAQVDEALGNALPSLSLTGNCIRNLLLPVFFIFL